MEQKTSSWCDGRQDRRKQRRAVLPERGRLQLHLSHSLIFPFLVLVWCGAASTPPSHHSASERREGERFCPSIHSGAKKTNILQLLLLLGSFIRVCFSKTLRLRPWFELLNHEVTSVVLSDDASRLAAARFYLLISTVLCSLCVHVSAFKTFHVGRPQIIISETDAVRDQSRSVLTRFLH